MAAGSYGFTSAVSQANIVNNKGSSLSYATLHSLSRQLNTANLKALQANCTYTSSGGNTAHTQNRAKSAAPIVDKKPQGDGCMYTLQVPSVALQESLEAKQISLQGHGRTIIDGDHITEYGLDCSLQQEHTSSLQVNPSQTRDRDASMARTAGENDDGDDDNSTESGLDGMSTWENTFIEELQADNPVIKERIIDISTQAPTITGVDKKIQEDDDDDGIAKNSGLDGMSILESNSVLQQDDPSSCSSLSEEKAVETQNRGSEKGRVMIDASEKDQVDDSIIKDSSSVDGMTSFLQQEDLHARFPTNTARLEKRGSEAQFIADATQARNAGKKEEEEDVGSVNSASLRHLNIKEFTQELTSLLQQQDMDLRQVYIIQAIVVERGSEQNSFLCNLLMSMYRRVGFMENAILIFNKMPYPDVVSWNAIMSLLSENTLTDQAFQLYLEMRKQGIEPSQITLITALSTCTNLAEGKAIHAYIRDHVQSPRTKLLNALINMYGKCGDLENARAVFDSMSVRDVVSWNSVLVAYSENIHGKRSKGKEPIELFWQMQEKGGEPNAVTVIAVLGSCANAALLRDGILIHAYIIERGFESNVVVGNALINMYGKCRALDDAFVVFARVPKKTEVSWNALITACSEQTQASKAFHLYQEMVKHGITPNDITFLGLLGACAQPDALALGKAIHKEILCTRFKSLTYMNNALMNMYGKCGGLEDAQSVFDTMGDQNRISWSTLIAAYSENGRGEDALELFKKMQRANIKPNEIMFLHLLTACCHAELLKEGTFFFSTMVDKYRIMPSLRHYTCMVDLLGRVGQLAQAEDMINEMPCPPDSQIWMALLAACRLHKDAMRANRAAQHVFHLSPQDVPTCSQSSNVDDADGRWDDVDKAREAIVQSV